MQKYYIRTDNKVSVIFVDETPINGAKTTYRSNMLRWFYDFDDAVADELAVLAAGNYIFRSEYAGPVFWTRGETHYQQWSSKALEFRVVEDAIALTQLLKSYGFTPWP